MSQTEKKIAFISAATLLLSTLEYLIPKPLPFLRLGLANLPLLVILDGMSFGPFFIILLLKAVGQGMVSGTLFSYLFLISLAGTLSSGIAMKGAKQLLGIRVSLVGCSLLGAFVSNLSQLQVASWVAYGPSIWIAAPLMLALGMVTSFALGLLAEIYLQRGTTGKALTQGTLSLSIPPTEEKVPHKHLLFASLLAIVAILLAKGLVTLAVITALMYLLQWVAGRRIRIIPALMLIFSLVVLSLFEPNGKVLLSMGTLAFTEGSLTIALTKALRLLSLLAASQSLSASNPKIEGKAGTLLALTLAYFSLLTRSFRETKGSVIQRVDQALQATASGKGTDKTPPVTHKKPINIPLFLFIVLGVLAVSLISLIVY
ncbi:Gx transporter family protein [uncultured Sphaerochaeta sp.]|uniref:Gx transporter family protein n=1 Tax=uncultured Sphaerochaeta sp. TaxID=886478 RepID=UPI002A0A17D5|nr:Gx transporter family protein [uncultured Sphaerochaeta sp.]